MKASEERAKKACFAETQNQHDLDQQAVLCEANGVRAVLVASSKTSSKSIDDCGYLETFPDTTFPYTERENSLFSGA